MHCPTASVLGKSSVSAFSIESFRTALSSKQYAIEFETDAANLKVSGTLWGGNLSVLVSALGTPYFPDIEGGVLFLEDLAEPAYKIERNLLQLAQAGVLQKAASNRFGTLLSYKKFCTRLWILHRGCKRNLAKDNQGSGNRRAPFRAC